jgi:hypothetical protein
MKKWRVRLLDKQALDGIIALDFVVSADDKDDAMFRAGMLLAMHHPTIQLTWVANVTEETF